VQLGFAKAHHKISLKEKRRCGPESGELPDIWGFPFNISATAEAGDFNIGTQLGFAKTHNKITPSGKSGGGRKLGKLRKILEFP